MKIDCNKITTLRTTRHWTQEDLAAASGLSGRTVQRVEKNGRGSLDTIRALAAAFDMSVDDLTLNEDAFELEQHSSAKFHQTLGFWMTVVLCFLVGVGALSFLVFTYIARYQEGWFDTFYAVWLIVRSLVILVMLFLAPTFLILAGVCLAQQKLKLARRCIILSLCALLVFAIGGTLLLGQPIKETITPLFGLYLAFYATLFGGFEVLRRKSQFRF